MIPALLIAVSLAAFIHEDPVADRMIRDATEATYDLRLPEARKIARAVQARYPEHPVGFVLEAETYWWEAQADRGNVSIEEDYYEAQKTALEIADRALDSGDYPRIEILSYLAAADGSYARFQITQKEAFFSALRAGLRAHGYAKQVHALDPEFYDVYVGLGAFNYFTGSLPAILKPFAFIIGARGDRETGIDQLRIARERGRYSRTEARVVSYTTFLEDGQMGVAFELLEGLRRDYPTNYVFFDWVTDWFLRQGRTFGAMDYFEQAAAQDREVRPVVAKWALLEKARLQHAISRPGAARGTIERIKAIPGGDALLLRKLGLLEARVKAAGGK